MTAAYDIPIAEGAAVVNLGARYVGERQPAYVIAEAGVNHNGRADQALRLVDAAVAAQADAVKFQVFRADELAANCAPPTIYQRRAGASSQRSMLKALELRDADLDRIVTHCNAAGITFLATPFGVNDVARLLRLGVCAFKIASSDLNNSPLVDAAARTGRPLIVSTGASTATEILTRAAALCNRGLEDRLILMHCVSRYPTPLEDANLRAIRTLRAATGVPVGYSDHTTSVDTGGWAVAAGACVLEKHFTLDRSAAGPDHSMSLDPGQLAAYVANVRAVELALGTGALGLQPGEEEVRRIARKSVVAASDIEAGTQLTTELLSLKRPGGGIEPDRCDELIGRRLTVRVQRDTVLTWEMLG